jgi:hypothetical protein
MSLPLFSGCRVRSAIYCLSLPFSSYTILTTFRDHFNFYTFYFLSPKLRIFATRNMNPPSDCLPGCPQPRRLSATAVDASGGGGRRRLL